MKTLILLSMLTLLLSSCAKNMVVSYQAESNNSGIIKLKPSKPTVKTYVSINNKLVIDKKNVKSVTINNVPVGKNIVHYTSDYKGFKQVLDSKFYVNIEPFGLVTQDVEIPPYKEAVYVAKLGLLGFALLLAIGSLTITLSRIQSLP